MYAEVERQVLLGNLEMLHWTARPLPRALIARRVAEALKAGRTSPGLELLAREFGWEIHQMGEEPPFPRTSPFWTIGPLESQVIFNGILETTGELEHGFSPDWNASRFGAHGTYWHHDDFSLYGDFVITGIEDAERFGNHVSGDFSLLTPRFGAHWHGDHFQAWFSREPVRWGPGRSGGLMVGGGSRAFTHLGYRVHVGNAITASAYHGWLSAAEGRYVAYHRVEGHLGPVVMALAGGSRYNASSPDPLYLINLIPYAAAERTANIGGEVKNSAEVDSLFRSNTMLSGDITWRFRPGGAVYGELLVDDLKIDEDLPQRIGYQIGALQVWSNPASEWSLQGEYTRIYNTVYSTYYGRNFEYAGEPLGYPRGPDLEAIDLWLDWNKGLSWGGRLHTFLINRGEGRVGIAWCPEFFEKVPDNENCAFLGRADGSDFLGVVETSWGFLAGPVWTPRDNVYAKILGGLVSYENLDHVSGEDATHLLGSVSLGLRW